MSALAIRSAPIVAPGAGGDIADKYASRLVGQWLDALYAESHSAAKALHKHFLTREGRIGGNPIAQRRWAARVERMFGSRLLASRLETGSRARFHLQLDVLLPTNWRGLAATPGELAWLAGFRMDVSRAGAESHPAQYLDFVAAISKHALVRMVQRCGCETAADLHAAFRAAWPVLSRAEEMTREQRQAEPSLVWRIPVNLPTMAEPAIFVMAGPSPDDDPRVFFVKTAFPISFLGPRERADALATGAALIRSTTQ
ncbi:MAG TPA: hypothetical protein VIF88_03800 [Methylocystis sp.]|jgi:hypothetical protein